MPPIRTASALGFATLLGILNIAGSANAFPIKVPSWLRPNSTSVNNATPTTPLPPAPVVTSQNPPASNTTGTTTAAASTTVGQSGYRCQFVNGQYTVMYLPQSQPSLAYPWAVPQALGGGWTPERRCTEISRRLETYRPDGLIELQTGQENGYNTVCVTAQKVPGCRIVFTVPNGQDPITTRDSVFQNIAFAEKGQQTQGVNTFVDQGQSPLGDLLKFGRNILGAPQPTGVTARTASGGIDLRPFLDPADGGTGTQLRQGIRRSR